MNRYSIVVSFLAPRGDYCSQILLVFFTIFTYSPTYAYNVGSRPLFSGGATQMEGSAGGGLTPWATLSGYGDHDEWGGDIFTTAIRVDDYDFIAHGISFAYDNRIELSFATQSLAIGPAAKLAGFPDDEVKQHIAGVKLRLFGNVLSGQWPQISLGMQYKKNIDFDVPAIAGALDDDGIDIYLAATKLFHSLVYDYPILINTTFRSTKANQYGLLGFGGDLDSGRNILFETTVGILLRHNVGIGFEYRQQPNNLSFTKEQDSMGPFVAWFPNKHFSLVGAWVDLGEVGNLKSQDGVYMSFEVSY